MQAHRTPVHRNPKNLRITPQKFRESGLRSRALKVCSRKMTLIARIGTNRRERSFSQAEGAEVRQKSGEIEVENVKSSTYVGKVYILFQENLRLRGTTVSTNLVRIES